MPEYQYTAQNLSKQVMKGVITSLDRETALAALQDQNLRPISLVEKTIASSRGVSIKLPVSTRIKTKDLVVFTRQLSTMIGAGVPILRSLNTLTEQAENPAMKTALLKVSKDVSSGSALADAFAKHPNAFNDVYTNMVRAGEAGGILDDILKRLAIQQEKSAAIKKKVKSAMTYPIILMVITVLAFFGMMLFVIPRIGQILTDLGGPDAELPALTQAMLAISSSMTTFWYIYFGVLIGAVFALRYYLKTPVGKATFDRFLLKVPVIKTVITKLAVARFARTFASLMGAGVGVLEALKVTGDALGNTVFKEELARAANEVKNGRPLSESLAQKDIFPGIVPQMLAVGEETGQTGSVLIKVADFYEEEVDALIEGLSSIIEPIMIVIMGGMVGLIAASVMGPISSLSQNIQ